MKGRAEYREGEKNLKKETQKRKMGVAKEREYEM
jgi:hypothetical protein